MIRLSHSTKENTQGGMHSSSSATDLHALSTMAPNPGMSAYPQYPFSPHMAPQYQGTFPMYPQYPVYPHYFGNSWANLSNPVQTTDCDFSDQSENSHLHLPYMRNAVFKDKKAKRSQSVVDRIPYQGQFYPYGAFSSGGYPPAPWIPGNHVTETPPSPATSLRSLSRLSQSQRRKKVTDEEEDDFSSSPLSRPKSSSSEVSKLPRQVRKPSCQSSSSDETMEKNKRRSKASPAVERRQLKQEMLKKRASSPRRSSASRESSLLGRRYCAENKKPSKVHSLTVECKENSENSACESSKAIFKNENEFDPLTGRNESNYVKEIHSWIPFERWHCKHCTFLNEPGERICRVCCKTVIKSIDEPKDEVQSGVRNNSNSIDLYNKSDVKEVALISEKRDMAYLNSALDEAEKEITRSLDELLKIKEESNGQDEAQPIDTLDCSVSSIKKNPLSEEVLNISVSQEHSHIKEATTSGNISGLPNNTSTSSQSHNEYNERSEIDHKVASMNMHQIAHQKDVLESHPAYSRSATTETEPSVPMHTITAEPQSRKDSFCQTYQDVVLPEFSPEKKIADSNVLTKNYIYSADKNPSTQSSLPFDTYHPDRGIHGVFGLHRAHSRASLFGGRLSDASPSTYENGGIGFTPSMYRSLSRSSLLGDAEGWTSDYQSRHKPDFYLSMEELVERRRQESMRAQGLELVRMIREAEQQGFTADDIQVALNNCGKQNPVHWLQENWKKMIHTVLTLATNYGRDKKENDVGGISQNEARDALRLHKGNIWAAVTECIEGRQRKFLELSTRGNFNFCEIVDALTVSEGNVEMAYSELTKTSLKPFLMRVWGSGEGAQNLDAAQPKSFTFGETTQANLNQRKHSEAVVSDKSMSGEDIWDDEDYDYEEWEDDEEDIFKQSDKETRVKADIVEETTVLIASYNSELTEPEELEKSSTFSSLLTPESDKSEYCDAIGPALNERYLSSASIDEIYLLGEDADEIFEQDSTTLFESKLKRTGFLKKLANLKRVALETENNTNGSEKKSDIPLSDHDNNEMGLVQNSEEVKNIETDLKIGNPLALSKQLSSSLIDTMNSNIYSKKTGSSLSERRTIIVCNKIEKDSDKSISSDSIEKLPLSASFELPFSNENLNSVSYEDEINNSANCKLNVEGNMKSLKVTKINTCQNSDLSNSSCSTNGKILQSDAKSNATEISDEGNFIHKDVMDPIYNKTDNCRIATAESIYFQDDNEITWRSNEAASPRISASPDLCIVNNKKQKKTKENTLLKLVKKSTKVLENDLNVSINGKVNTINNQGIIDTDNNLEVKSSTIGLDSTEKNKANPKFPLEKSIDVHILLSKDDNESIGAKCQQIDIDNKIPKPTLSGAVLVENDAKELVKSNKGKKNFSLPSTTELIPVTDDKIVIDNSKTIMKIKKTKENLYDCSDGIDSIMVSTAEDNKVEGSEINHKHKEYNEIHEKVILPLTNEELVAVKKDSIDNRTVNKFQNRTSIQNSTQSDGQVILEVTESSLTAKPTNIMTSATCEGHESVFMPVTDSTIISEPNDNITSLGMANAESGNLEIADKVPNVNIDINDSISRNKNDEYVLSKDFISMTSINTHKEFIEVNSSETDMQNIEHDKILQRFDNFHMEMPDNKIIDKIHIKETNNNKSSPENGFKNSTEIGEIISLEKINENSLVININSHNSAQSKAINSKTVRILPNCNDKEISTLLIKQLNPGNNIGCANEVSELIPVKMNEKNIPNVLEVREENISEDSNIKECISEDLNIKEAISEASNIKEVISETFEIEVNYAAEVPNMEKQYVSEILEMKEFASEVSKTKGKNNLEMIETYASDIPKVKENIITDVSKVNGESTSDVSKVNGESTSAVSKVNGESTSAVSKVNGESTSAVSKVNGESTSAVSKVNGESTSNVSKVSGKSTSDVSKISETGHLSITSVDENIPKLLSEFQFENKLPELFSTFALNRTETEESLKNNLVDISSDLTNNAMPEQCYKNVIKNNNNNNGAENFNLLPINPLQNDIPENNATQIITPESMVSKTTSKLFTQKSSSTEESDIDLLKNEESPYSTDDFSKTEIVSEDDVNANGSLMSRPMSPIRPIGHLRRMSFNTRKEAIIQERSKDLTLTKIGESKPWFLQKKIEIFKPASPKRSIKQHLEFERKVRKLVADRKCRTYRKAEIVVQLLDMKFDEYESVEAANECSTLEQAISFLQQECQLCAGNYPIRDIISMVHCSHKACRECIKAYFTIQIRDRTIMELLCPFCNEPDITDEDVAQDYFNHLDIMLKKLVEEDIHELFQRKLRDRVLMKDPNFMWCTQCSSGFIADPYLKRLICPDCKAIMCASCRRLWERSHENISCEAFAAYKDSMDPQTTVLAKLLIENGIDCPSCHFRYALAKGGCMHFKCIQCQHDFCSGCSHPFKMGQKCGISEFCAKLGLHAHHPRNCLFYLRDKEPDDLEKLLDMNNIKYDKDQPEIVKTKNKCQVMEQKETAHGMIDDICGKEIQEGYAGLCRLHYVEYLGQLVNKHKIDPIQIFDNDDLELVLKRASIRMPPRKYRETSDEYREKLLQVIEERLPLATCEGS